MQASINFNMSFGVLVPKSLPVEIQSFFLPFFAVPCSLLEFSSLTGDQSQLLVVKA